MKLIKLCFLVAIGLQLLAFSYCSAQSFSLVKATQQNWNGGAVGHSGINYAVELETSSTKIIPDTLWINGKVYPVTFSGDNKSYRTTDSVTHKIKYTLIAGEYTGFRNRPDTTATENKKAVRHFKGVAMISYMQKYKQRFFTIKSFTLLKPLDYP